MASEEAGASGAVAAIVVLLLVVPAGGNSTLLNTIRPAAENVTLLTYPSIAPQKTTLEDASHTLCASGHDRNDLTVGIAFQKENQKK